MHDQLPNIEVYKILEEQGLLNEQQKEQYEELKAQITEQPVKED